MDEPRDDLLAGSRFTDDQDVAFAAFDHAEKLEHRAHAPAVADHKRVGGKRDLALPSRTWANEWNRVELGHVATAPQPRCHVAITGSSEQVP